MEKATFARDVNEQWYPKQKNSETETWQQCIKQKQKQQYTNSQMHTNTVYCTVQHVWDNTQITIHNTQYKKTKTKTGQTGKNRTTANKTYTRGMNNLTQTEIKPNQLEAFLLQMQQ